MTSPGTTLVDRLRRENLDQYLTLVRMHLSFVVDINTDDVDCSTDKPKQFRWNFHKKTKNVNSSHNNTSNVKNNIEAYSITEEGILRLNELIDFLSKPENVTQEGIFRRTGSLSRQQELRQLLSTGSNLDLDEGRFSVHDCASVLKGFLADLPQPLLMDRYYQIYCTLSAQYPPNAETSEPKLLTALQLLLLLLTPLHRSFLERLLKLLHLVADNEASNRMSPDTLATMFTPHLLCPRKLSPEVFHADAVALSPLVSLMIRACESVLRPPAPLATDAAAYFRRRRTQRVDLDESQTDRTAARTVYTFVDRGLSGAGAAGGGAEGGALTDTALAQLYAHIHALPDSAHRRRLIKHFNRHNGYGTPLQIQRTGKVAGSRSFGDSIKRHIFNKGILNKTPKKGSGSAINTIEENTSKGKHQRKSNDKVDVSHKNIVLKNLANKIASAESLDDNIDYETDASNESTLSEGAVNKSRKNSPKFASEPNLNTIEANDETPKNTKRRLFRSKVVSRNLSKKYQKRGNFIRGTPTCVSCVDNDPTDSDSDLSTDEEQMELVTPKQIELKHYTTSTPGLSEAFDGERSTPYSVKFRRASMSPITKSTQKLPKAMQESIMTPRSRKPLIMSERERERDRDVIAEPQNKEMSPKPEHIYCSVSPKNDSDFVSSDDEDHNTRSLSEDRLHTSKASVETAQSISETNQLSSKPTGFTLSHERPKIQDDLNTTLCGTEDGLLLMPKCCNENQRVDCKRTSLTDPFREYLLSRSVLTATPVDLSILNKSTDDEKITDSMMYCLDGNVPSDLTSSISNLAVNVTENARTPLTVISPNRKRCMQQSNSNSVDSKKLNAAKENYEESYEIRETDL